ncbi:MAG: hypothetical protein JF590_04070, partial [Gemmatimonadetes bacterium]|nr:hypothetical protein [Gemmatimonadota bacterium]
LARTPGLRVVTTARLYQFIPAGGGDDPGALPRAAQEAGATEMVDGALFQRPDGTLRLDLRRVQVADGEVLQVLTVEGRDPFQLVDAGTTRLLSGLGREAPTTSIADVTTRSIAAYRLYEQGLRTYAEGDAAAAEPLFAAAVAEDSAFAMAAYYLALSSGLEDPTERLARFERAMRLADRAGDRERLMIRAAYASATTDPALGALADSLRRLYPDEITGYLYAAQARITLGEFTAALAPLDSAIRRDSAAPLPRDGGTCARCDALSTRVVTWILLDSLVAAEREARRWIRLVPASPRAQELLAEVLDREGRTDEAFAAIERASVLDPAQWSGPIARARFLIRAGRLREAIDGMTTFAATGPARYRNEGVWHLVLAEREGGDYTRALADARRYRRDGGERAPPGAAPSSAALEGIVLLEAGRAREAAFLFDSIGHGAWPGSPPSSVARNLTWSLVRSADAWAAAGDTARLQALADSAQVAGARSGLGRDQRLHHHVRGLLWLARGRPEEAAREFRSAIYSYTDGYTRSNLMLARALQQLGRREEAARVLRAALDGPLDGSNLYVTRRELQAELAKVER